MRLAGALPLTAIACASLAVAVAGCGGGDAGGTAMRPTVTFGVAPDGQVSGPARVGGGVVTVRLSNGAKGEVDLQLARITGDRSDREVRDAVAAGNEGRIAPWLRLEGGVGATPPGTTAVATQSLPAGRYVAVNTAEQDEPSIARFTVVGASAAPLPRADVTVVARDYRFGVSGPMTTGSNVVRFENAGAQPHHMIVLPLLPGKTAADVRRFVASDGSGRPPFSEDGVGTAVLDGGRSQVTGLRLAKPGKYAVVCFIADRQGGPPHAAMGMVSELTVR
jgi:hypothetical protein